MSFGALFGLADDHGLGFFGELTQAAQALVALLDSQGLHIAADVVQKIPPTTVEYLLQMANQGGTFVGKRQAFSSSAKRVVQLINNYGNKIARLEKIVDGIKVGTAAPGVSQAGGLMKFLGSSSFATITGLLSIAWDSKQITQASAAATDAMDQAQVSGRLTNGAVQKAFNALPSDLQHAVQSIKDAQTLISGYTTMKFNTQKLMAKETDPGIKAAYQDLINRCDAKINGLSGLLDVMRQTGYKGWPKKTKTTSGATQSSAVSSIYKQWLAQSNKKDSASAQALFSQIMSTTGQQQIGVNPAFNTQADMAAYKALISQGLLSNTAMPNFNSNSSEAQNYPGAPDYGPTALPQQPDNWYVPQEEQTPTAGSTDFYTAAAASWGMQGVLSNLGGMDDCPPTCTDQQIRQIRNGIRMEFLANQAVVNFIFGDNPPNDNKIKAYVDKAIAKYMSNDPSNAWLMKYAQKYMDKTKIKNDIEIGKALIKYFSNPRVTTIPNVEVLSGLYAANQKVGGPAVGDVLTNDTRNAFIREGIIRLARHGVAVPDSVAPWLGKMYKADGGGYIDATKVMDAMDGVYGGGLFEGKRQPQRAASQASAFSPLPIISPSVVSNPMITPTGCAGAMVGGQCITSQQDLLNYSALLNQGLLENTMVVSGAYDTPGLGPNAGPQFPAYDPAAEAAAIAADQQNTGTTTGQSYASEAGDIAAQYPGIYGKSAKKRKKRKNQALQGIESIDEISALYPSWHRRKRVIRFSGLGARSTKRLVMRDDSTTIELPVSESDVTQLITLVKALVSATLGNPLVQDSGYISSCKFSHADVVAADKFGKTISGLAKSNQGLLKKLATLSSSGGGGSSKIMDMLKPLFKDIEPISLSLSKAMDDVAAGYLYSPSSGASGGGSQGNYNIDPENTDYADGNYYRNMAELQNATNVMLRSILQNEKLSASIKNAKAAADLYDMFAPDKKVTETKEYRLLKIIFDGIHEAQGELNKGLKKQPKQGPFFPCQKPATTTPTITYDPATGEPVYASGTPTAAPKAPVTGRRFAGLFGL